MTEASCDGILGACNIDVSDDHSGARARKSEGGARLMPDAPLVITTTLPVMSSDFPTELSILNSQTKAQYTSERPSPV
jgi:hypothetical protein